ncbi:MAG: hypothetical protein WAM97_08210, partial [Acidimicrobiales bacterium]
FVPWSTIFSKRTFELFIPPIGLSMALLFWYNDLRYGRIWVSSYGNTNFTTPLGTGLHGLLLSSGDSMFIFNPMALVGVAGLILLAIGPMKVRDRPLFVLCFLLIVPRVLFFSKFSVWWGGSTFGPRFLLPVAAVLTLLIPPVLTATESPRIVGIPVRIVSVALAGCGALVCYVSVRMPMGEWFGVTQSPGWRKILGIHGINNSSQLFHALYFQFSTSQLRLTLTLIARHYAVPSGYLWVHGYGVLGYVLVGASGVILLVTVIGTRRTSGPSISSIPTPIASEARVLAPKGLHRRNRHDRGVREAVHKSLTT